MSDELSNFSMLELFRLEVDNQAAILNEGLLALEHGNQSAQQLEALMRAAHSVKGAARMVGNDDGVLLAHAVGKAGLFWLSGLIGGRELTTWSALQGQPLLIFAFASFLAMLIGLPRFYGIWLLLVMGLSQHLGLAEDVLDHRLNSRTVLMNPVLRFISWGLRPVNRAPPMGRTLLSSASCMKRALSSASFSGCSAATSCISE